MPPKRKEPIDTAKQHYKRAKKSDTDEDNGEIEDNSEKVCLSSEDNAAGARLTDDQDETNAVSSEEKPPKDVKEVAEDKKEANEFKLPHPTVAGELLISGGTDWDLIGRKEIPKNTVRKGGPNLWKPHRISGMAQTRISYIESGAHGCHSIVVKEDGQAMSFGRNEKGQLGHGDTIRRDEPTIIHGLRHSFVVQASCGRGHTLVLLDDGSVFGFGDNKLAQLGQGHQKPCMPSPIQVFHPENKKVVHIGCGGEFSMIADVDGDMFGFGCPEFGQLGNNTDGKYFITSNKMAFDCEVLPKKVALFVDKGRDGNIVTPIQDVKIKKFSCGTNHVIALDSKERVYTWGFGGYGRLGHNQQKDERVPRLLTMSRNTSGCSDVFAGSSYTLAIFKGQLYFWGKAKPTGEATMYPKQVMDLNGWSIRSVGRSKTSIVVAADESIVSWGTSPTYGELAYGDGQKSSSTPKIAEPLEGIHIHSVTCGMGHSLFIARTHEEGDMERIGRLLVYEPPKTSSNT